MQIKYIASLPLIMRSNHMPQFFMSLNILKIERGSSVSDHILYAKFILLLIFSFGEELMYPEYKFFVEDSEVMIRIS